jgi:chromosome partitioning protein
VDEGILVASNHDPLVGSPLGRGELSRIVTVAASKGGVGKTTLSLDLAAVLPEALAVDLDWDTGGLTRMWGHDPTERRTARLLDSMESGRPPRPLRARRRPDLVPSHPDLAPSAISATLVADLLQKWAAEWESEYRYVVVDTHPGANPLTDGAMAAADVVLVPVVLGARELDALEGMLDDFEGYRMLLVPMKVPASPPKRWVERLNAAAIKAHVQVAPAVSFYPAMSKRVRRAALSLEPNPGAWVSRVAEEYRAVGDRVEECCG